MNKYNKWLSNGPDQFYYFFEAKDIDGSGVAAEVFMVDDKIISYIIRGNHSLPYFMSDNVPIEDDILILATLNECNVQRDAIKWSFITNADHESYIIKDFS